MGVINDIFDGIGDFFSSIISWLIPMPDLPELGNVGTDISSQEARSIKVNKTGNNTQIPIIYGIRRSGGNLIYLNTGGTDNEYLYGAIALSEGQVDGLLQILVDDQVVTFSNHNGFDNLEEALAFDGDAGDHITPPFVHTRGYTSNDERFFDTIRVEFFDGRDTQPRSLLLAQQSDWGINHRLQGIAFCAFRLRFNTDCYNGLPQFQFDVKGKKVFDPRTSTTAWSANPALVLLDYLRNDRYGKGLADTFFDSNFQSFQDSADLCDTKVDPYDTPSVTLKKLTVRDTSKTGLLGYRYNSFYWQENPRRFRNIGRPSGSNRDRFTSGTSFSGKNFNPDSDREFTSYVFKGYFVPNETTSYQFKINTDNAGAVYLGEAGRDVEDFYDEITESKVTNVEGLIVSNPDDQPNQDAESSLIPLNNGSEYPIVILFGNGGGAGAFSFQWKKSGGSYSGDLSSLFQTEESFNTVTSNLVTLTNTPIFSCHAVIDTSQKIINNVKSILNTCRGFMPYSKGVYKLNVEGTGTASITLDEDDIIGGISVKSQETNARYNRVFVNFINPEKNFESDQAQFPPADDSDLATADQYATLLSDDDNIPLHGNFDFKYLCSPYQAEEMAEVILRRSRNMLNVNIQTTAEASELEVGDIVNITHSGMGFSAKPFRVQNMDLNNDFTINLTLSEHQDAFYTWQTKRQRPVIEDTTLPNPFTIKTPSITSVVDELIELQDGTIGSIMRIEASSEDFYLAFLECRIKRKGVGAYENLGTSTAGTFEKLPVKEGATYQILVRAVNTSGVKSDYVFVEHTVTSAFEPPNDITDYSVELSGDKLIHQWTPPTDLDLSHYVLKYSKKSNETKFANGVIIGDKIPRNTNRFVTPIFNDGTYMIRPVDLFGIPSENFDSVVLDFDSETQIFGKDFKAVQTITEEPDFTGTKTDCVATDIGLILGTGLFDDAEGDFDDALGLFDAGLGTVVSSGSYEFDGFDFSNKFPFKLLLHDLDVIHLNYSDSFDATAGFFDSKEGTFDEASDANQEDVIDCKLFVATSDDAVSYSAFKEFENGDFIARAVKFKAVLSSTNPTATPVVENLSIKLILPRLIQSDNDVASLSGADKVIDYDNAFYEKPQLTVTAEDMLSGDYFTVSNSDRTGFDISFYDSTNSRVVRNFSYNSIGIGQQQ